MSQSASEQSIAAFRRGLAFVYALKYTLILATVWAFVWGGVVLGLRCTLGIAPEPLLWGLLPMPLVLAPAIWLAFRQLPSPQVVRSLLDKQNQCGGMLMASEDRALGQWGRQLNTNQSPRVHWQGGRFWGLFALSAAFVTVAFLLPQQYMRLGAEPPLEVGREVERLNSQIEVLKEERIIQQERAEAMQERLEKIEDDAKGTDPIKTLDALDHLEKLAKDAAKDAAEKAIQESEKLGKAEALADALKKHADQLAKKTKDEQNPDRLGKKKKDQKDGMDAKTLTKAMKELARLTREALKDNKGLQRQLDKKLQEQLDKELNKGQKGNLDPETLKKLAESLGESKGELMKKLMKLQKVRLIDEAQVKECKGSGQCNSDELLALLKKNKGGKMSMKKMLQMAGGMPGRGGINRGRGDAPMIFGSKTSEEQKKFKEAILPPARLAELKKSKVVGSTKVQPKVGNDGELAQSGALQGAKAGGGSANRQVILPRHRRAVNRYFERE